MAGVFFMTIYQAIILGVVQGITEFLPISSSGHLALISAIFNIEGDLLFGVILHVATLIPVTFVYKKELFSLLLDGKKMLCLIVATIPAGVVGLIFSDVIDKMFSNVKMLSWTFFTTALLLILCHSLDSWQTSQPAH
jgi:undecaprenyl-diphosphatase